MSISANFPNVFPSLELNFAQSQQLDPRVTFSRSTTAPYYDGKTSALAEQNLFIQSNTFTNAAWVATSATIASGVTAPDGTATAYSMTATAGNATLYQTLTLTATAYTESIWIQRVTGTGTINLTLDGTTLNPVTITGSWAKYTYTATPTAGAKTIGIQIVTSGDAINIYGSQIENRSSATATNITTTSALTNYIPQLLTAPINAPRFDFNPTTGESLGLLIEEQRTNLVLQSAFVSGWSNTNTSSSLGANIAPDGTQTAIKLVENSGLAYHNIQQSVSVTTPTFSIYAKAGERSQIAIFVGGVGVGVGFDLSNGTVISIAGYTSGSATSTITSVGNGWYRCAIAFAGTTSFFQIGMASGSAGNYTGNGYSGVYIWGAQAEAGSFATSYIPTTSAQVTRANDNASMTGTNFSSWYNQAQGTIYCDWIRSNTTAGVYDKVIALKDNGVQNEISFVTSNFNTIQQFTIVTNNVTQVAINSTTQSVGNSVKASGSYSTNNANYALNGTNNGSSSSVLVPNLINQMLIGIMSQGRIKKLVYYPQALTSAQNQALTGS